MKRYDKYDFLFAGKFEMLMSRDVETCNELWTRAPDKQIFVYAF